MTNDAEPTCPGSGAPGGADTQLPEELRLWMRLLSAAGTVEQIMAKQVKQTFGISHDEFLVLCLLAEQPGASLRMTQIAELLGRPKTRLTYQVGCLSHTGLVTRESVSGDRRGIALTLTAKARRLLAEKGPDLAAAVCQALAETIGPDWRRTVGAAAAVAGHAHAAGGED
ncbi:MarR family winged helix-turn-helix transcriptional regulator [Actinocrinis sp.]|uniref:MarR family winged helix-turn-helix transcriptional regulator n=1 Tax=Actinocrinis sp. TaxID=1920516 RepID=UPI002D745A49|nr:MarR family transcriptional regulator [Actinocrinis sp.]HZP55100.1 MarR family transcriptional regulator [Actinocrinis sp.]